MTHEQIKLIVKSKAGTFSANQLKLLDEFCEALSKKLAMVPRKMTDDFILLRWNDYKEQRKSVYGSIV